MGVSTPLPQPLGKQQETHSHTRQKIPAKGQSDTNVNLSVNSRNHDAIPDFCKNRSPISRYSICKGAMGSPSDSDSVDVESESDSDHRLFMATLSHVARTQIVNGKVPVASG